MSAVEIGRSRPSDGRLSTVPSKASVVEPPPSSCIAADGAEPDHRLRDLEGRHPDRVAGLPAVDATSRMRPSASLADRRPRMPRRELRRRERLVRAEHRRCRRGRAPGRRRSRRRPSSQSGLEDQPQRHGRPERRLGLQLRGAFPARRARPSRARSRRSRSATTAATVAVRSVFGVDAGKAASITASDPGCAASPGPSRR